MYVSYYHWRFILLYYNGFTFLEESDIVVSWMSSRNWFFVVICLDCLQMWRQILWPGVYVTILIELRVLFQMFMILNVLIIGIYGESLSGMWCLFYLQQIVNYKWHWRYNCVWKKLVFSIYNWVELCMKRKSGFVLSASRQLFISGVWFVMKTTCSLMRSYVMPGNKKIVNAAFLLFYIVYVVRESCGAWLTCTKVLMIWSLHML